MAKKRTSKVPDVPWGDTGDEIIEAGIGKGFVKWESFGEFIRGKLLRRWRSRSMRSPAVTIELTEVPRVPIYNTEDRGAPKLMTCVPGEKVNVSLSFDLDQKLTLDLEGQEIGLYYAGDQSTPKGSMRVFRVFRFEPDQRSF